MLSESIHAHTQCPHVETVLDVIVELYESFERELLQVTVGRLLGHSAVIFNQIDNSLHLLRSQAWQICFNVLLVGYCLDRDDGRVFSGLGSPLFGLG